MQITFVSRATVINDLEDIKIIKEGKLSVLSHPNKGLRVEGNESDKDFLMRLVNQKRIVGQDDEIVVLVFKQANYNSKIVYEQEHIHKVFN